ncbi:hypothetical protein AK830_g5798 [Neonectria ditissima]|uniref:Cytochrome P450 n=1 Tax=Neonectria ditissima TaxID=78410 RepID=A0A0P7BKG4_9HYPO|nr:hypothetical protein AK830_g5798 [Neonectria ditissima]
MHIPSPSLALAALDFLRSDETVLTYQNCLVGVAIVFILWGTSLTIYRVWFHPLSKFPGPLLLAVSHFPFLYHNYVTGTWVRRMVDLHAKYGPAVRIGPNHLALDGAIAWPEVHGRRPRGSEEFGKKRGHAFKGDHNALTVAPTTQHRRIRRQLAYGFSNAALMEQEASLLRHVDLLVQCLAQRAELGTPVNLADWFNFTTFDIIGDLTLSESFDCPESKHYHPWVLSIFSGVRGIALKRFFSSLWLPQALVRWLSADIAADAKVRNHAVEMV